MIWGANPAYTQIPNMHFLNEARYNGVWVVTIGLDYLPRRPPSHWAKERGIESFLDREGAERRLDDFHERFTFDERFGEGSQTALAEEIVDKTSYIDKNFEQLRETGFTRINGIGIHPVNLGNATDILPDEPAVNRRWSGKPPPPVGGDYPLVLSGGHTRWSIHSGWRNLDLLLRLQSGEAAAFVAGPDAHARGIADGDLVRLWNDVGEFVVHAKVSQAVQPGSLIIYHAWEDYQFHSGRGYRNVLPSPINPAELAGGYRHLRPVPAGFQPG